MHPNNVRGLVSVLIHVRLQRVVISGQDVVLGCVLSQGGTRLPPLEDDAALLEVGTDLVAILRRVIQLGDL